MKRFFSFSILAVLLAVTFGCRKEMRPLEIADILRQPSKYNGQVVSVHGCYHSGFETTVLAPCAKPTRDQFVWVVPYTVIENSEKAIPGYHARSTRTEQPSLEEQELYARLAKMPDGISTEIVVRGEFQFSASPRFGHTPGYKHQLILYRVLQLK